MCVRGTFGISIVLHVSLGARFLQLTNDVYVPDRDRSNTSSTLLTPVRDAYIHMCSQMIPPLPISFVVLSPAAPSTRTRTPPTHPPSSPARPARVVAVARVARWRTRRCPRATTRTRGKAALPPPRASCPGWLAGWASHLQWCYCVRAAGPAEGGWPGSPSTSAEYYGDWMAHGSGGVTGSVAFTVGLGGTCTYYVCCCLCTFSGLRVFFSVCYSCWACTLREDGEQ